MRTEPSYIPAKVELAIARDVVVLITKKLHCTVTIRSWAPLSLQEIKIGFIKELHTPKKKNMMSELCKPALPK
jgi:hypothetical protein